MKRRDFVVAAGGAALGWPMLAWAQAQRTYRVGHAWVADAASVRPYEEAFLSVLRDRGYVLGQNLLYDNRYADNDPGHLPVLVDELIALKPDVLTGIEPVARVMLSKTSIIPIVMVNSVDPIAAGLVKSLSHPGGNVTGVSMQYAELGPKHIELLREILPRLTRIGQLLDPNVPASQSSEQITREAALKLGIAYHPYYVPTRTDVEKAFVEMESQRPDALLTGPGSGLLYGLRQVIVDNTSRLRIPYVTFGSIQPRLGALMGYGPDLPSGNRLAATYVDRILKGAKPSELPVEQPTKFELVINLKTAKALGLTIPATVLARADEVIE